MGLAPLSNQQIDDPVLVTECWGKIFSNPLGLAAGFDKNGEALRGLSKIGFGFVEIGSVTPLPQDGNPKPRVFRLQDDEAVVNRYGFNSDGADAVARRLMAWTRRPRRTNMLMGINLGKNKTSEDATQDYVTGVQKLGQYADYLVINISSPNTPHLRDLQDDTALEELYRAVREERDRIILENDITRDIPLLIKLAPDLDDNQKKAIAKMALKVGVEGIIISNTTTQRNGLKSEHKDEIGGLSGRPLTEMSTQLVKDMYELTNGQIPLVGVGGIFSGQDALDKIEAGASIVQVYTALSLQGPAKVVQIKEELTDLLKERGYHSASQAIGAKTSIVQRE
jgi:dihydroorotate dehydrogenase